ncbi:S1C family serine protease [Yinghuangia seranimata]|uniref:S1C family serine protease n=1 Tax=Yinghuangia seranimata TaxID=408067 RepID=UPI00248B6FE7|nr:trypsin-like peptidase domain-containing protein [Yinghuangia seranimata]MDI2131887.1 trypsin-like peptidase domain-containing protein [Yinghuangia seranimata]
MSDEREVTGRTPVPGEDSSLAPSEPEAFPKAAAPEGETVEAAAVPRPEAAPEAPAAAPPVPAAPPAAEAEKPAPAAPAAPPATPPAAPTAPAAEPSTAVLDAVAPEPAAVGAESGTEAAAASAAAGLPGTATQAGGGAVPPFGMPPTAPYPGYPGFGAPAPAKKRRPSPIVVTALVTALLAGGVGGGIGAWIADRDNGSSSSTVNTNNGPVDPAALQRAPESVAGIAAKSLPGTVTIKTKGGSGMGAQEGTGAGFVLDDQGHILTNNHVVSLAAGGGDLTVTFSDGRTVPGKIVGRAEGYDLAVVKVDGVTGLKPLPLGDSSAAAVGDPVLAIGSPYGLDGTVTTGIVSAKNRPVASGDQQQVSYMNALQTDASINPGNSGGPLLDAQGRVIGVNSAIRSAGSGSDQFGGQQQAGSIGLGFAIPINQAKWVADTLIQTGKPVYAQVGVIPDPSYKGVGARIRPSAAQGQAPVTPGGPADKAGLKAGDVITRLGDRPVTGYEELFSEIWSHRPGETIKVTYQRDGKEATTDLTLGQREGDQTR